MSAARVQVVRHIADLPRDAWDALLDPACTPFQEWTFLEALEHAGAVGPAAGWHPRHLALWEDGRLVAAAPAYVREDSSGEFVFDWAWAGAAARAGVRYYPKLVLAVPFTPVTGRRLLVAPGQDRATRERELLRAAVDLARDGGLSSVHVLFPSESELGTLEAEGGALRAGIQFHWDNPGYRSYDDFLARFDAKRRHQLRREARAPDLQGLTLGTRRGDALSAADCDAAFRLYGSTVDRHRYGRRYLGREFFARLLERFAHRIELVEARRGDELVAGAINVASPTRLYGRYWGCFEELPFLHFNVCFYHPIRECIARGTERFEGGAGGGHKLVRGFEPQVTWSAHWIFHRGLDGAIRDFLRRERSAVLGELAALRAATGLKALRTS